MKPSNHKWVAAASAAVVAHHHTAQLDPSDGIEVKVFHLLMSVRELCRFYDIEFDSVLQEVTEAEELCE